MKKILVAMASLLMASFAWAGVEKGDKELSFDFSFSSISNEVTEEVLALPIKILIPSICSFFLPLSYFMIEQQIFLKS